MERIENFFPVHILKPLLEPALAARSGAVRPVSKNSIEREEMEMEARNYGVEMNQTAYGFGKEMATDDFEEARSQVVEALKDEGFGVLTEIDVKATLKKKLDVDFRPYVILGACNPPIAYKALQTESELGLLLPCNVVVQKADNGKIRVSFIDPVAMMGATDNPALNELATEVNTKLRRVLDKLS